MPKKFKYRRPCPLPEEFLGMYGVVDRQGLEEVEKLDADEAPPNCWFPDAGTQGESVSYS